MSKARGNGVVALSVDMSTPAYTVAEIMPPAISVLVDDTIPFFKGQPVHPIDYIDSCQHIMCLRHVYIPMFNPCVIASQCIARPLWARPRPICVDCGV